jgi:Predicted dehydrogenases and related proteins
MSDYDPVPVAVVGAGNMGDNHIRVYDTIPEANLVEVVEPNPERAASVRENYDVDVLANTDDLECARAATIAVPNHYHRDVAVDLIKRGFDILVEKPLAMNREDAEAIVRTAVENNVLLQVGHIERFNPAVKLLTDILHDKKVIALEAHRLGPFNEHLTDESVIFDLMIHDIDVIRSLVDTPVNHVDAVGARSHSAELDHAVAHFKFDSGILGTMTSSHVTHSKIRTLTATTRETFIQLDYQQQRITVNRRGTEETTLFEDTSGYRTETIQETPFVQTREPLKNELQSFVKCVQTRETPLVDGQQALRAVELASEITSDIHSN